MGVYVKTSKIMILNAVCFAVYECTVLLQNVYVKCTTVSTKSSLNPVVVQIK